MGFARPGSVAAESINSPFSQDQSSPPRRGSWSSMFGKTPSYMDVVLPSQIRSPLRNSWLRPVSIPTSSLEPRASPGAPAGRPSPDDRWHRWRAGVGNLPNTQFTAGEAGRHGELASYLASSEPRPLMNGFLVSWAAGSQLGVVSLPAAEGEATAPRRNGAGWLRAREWLPEADRTAEAARQSDRRRRRLVDAHDMRVVQVHQTTQ